MAQRVAREQQPVLDQRLTKAIGHPLRVEILVELDRGPMSPNEFASFSGEDVSTVAYHFRTLAKCGAVALIDEKRRRGAVEHFYETRVRQFFTAGDKRRLPHFLRDSLSVTTIRTFMQRAEEALEAKTMDAREDRHLTWYPLELDEEGFAEVIEMLSDMSERVGSIELAARGRIAETGEGTIYTTVGLAGFESPPPPRSHSLLG
jgi:DNA-binding transcriptional ArsR family regulator